MNEEITIDTYLIIEGLWWFWVGWSLTWLFKWPIQKLHNFYHKFKLFSVREKTLSNMLSRYWAPHKFCCVKELSPADTCRLDLWENFPPHSALHFPGLLHQASLLKIAFDLNCVLTCQSWNSSWGADKWPAILELSL